MGSKEVQSLSFRPPGKLPLRQALVTEPESLAVIGQYTNGRAPPVGENKQGPTQGIFLESVAAQGAKSVDSGSKIDWINCQKDAHVGGDLDHGWLQNALAISMRWSPMAPLTLMRILDPSHRCTSMVHSSSVIVGDGPISMNLGAAQVRLTAGVLWPSMRRLR